MADRSYTCKYGCGTTVPQLGLLRPHYRDAHPLEYEKAKSERPAREKKARAGNRGADQAPAEDAETALLFSASALFAETLLPSDGYARVVAYLQQRFAGAPTAPERPALTVVG